VQLKTSLRDIDVTDVNGDGLADVILGDSDNRWVCILLSEGDGSFAPRQCFEGGSELSDIALGDANGDGRPDILTVSSFRDHVFHLLLNKGHGRTTLPPTAPSRRAP